MRRRDFIIALGGAAAAAPLAARAQQAKPPTLGVLVVGATDPEHFLAVLREGLRDFGYVDGQNIVTVIRSAGGDTGRLPALAAELVRLNVDIIVASETPAASAARQATRDIPIVMAPSGDPVGTGLIASLTRPGGNVTGLSNATAEAAGKSVELLREIVPSARRMAALCQSTNPFSKPFLEQVEAAGRSGGVEIRPVIVAGADEFETAFSAMAKDGVHAVVVQPTLPVKPAADLALKYRLPAASATRRFVELGGLMSYSGLQSDSYRRAAGYVDRILKGAKPADLPVQQPTKYELLVNLKTAKALGLVVPPTLLARVDEAIE